MFYRRSQHVLIRCFYRVDSMCDDTMMFLSWYRTKDVLSMARLASKRYCRLVVIVLATQITEIVALKAPPPRTVNGTSFPAGHLVPSE